jgi:hypothetical protein
MAQDLFDEMGIDPSEANAGGDLFDEIGVATDFSALREYGMENDERARGFLTDIAAAEAAGDEQERRRATIRLAGYLDGRDAIDGARGGDTQAERVGSRAETALRGAGQGIFGLGDFSAALGSWIGEGGPMGDFSLRDHFAYQRHRREGMSAENPVSSTTGYVAGAITGGGAVQAGVRQAAVRAPGVAGRAARFLDIRPAVQGGRSRVGNVARNAGGGALAGAAAGALEEGTEGDIGQAALVGAVASPVGERALQATAGLGRRALRRFGPGSEDRAAVAEIARQAFDPNQRVGTEAVDELAGRVRDLGPDAALIEGVNPTGARVLGESMTQSDEAVREAIPALSRIQSARAGRVAENIQGGNAPMTADDIAAREGEMGRRATRQMQGERAQADEALELERRGARRSAQAMGREALEVGEEQVSAAERSLQQRLQEATYVGDMVDPDDIRNAARQYGNDRMAEIADRPFTVPPQLANDLLNTRSVRNFLRDYAEDNPDAREGLLDLINAEPDPDAGFDAFNLTLRQADSLRRAADAAGEARPELRFRLTQLADRVEQQARSQVPEYSEFLTNFQNLMARADGAEAGFNVRGAQPSRLEARMDRLAGQSGTARVGAQQAGRRAIFDEATAGPRQARRAAERIVEDPRNVQTVMGPSAGRVVRQAEEGLAGVREAEEALAALRVRNQADLDELDDLYLQRRNRQSREFDERIAMIQDRIRDRQDAMRRAADVVNGSTSSVARGARMAEAEGLGEDFRGVARTSLAEAGGESGQAATDLSESLLRDPGLRSRVNEVFGEAEANRIFGIGGREARGAEATLEAARGANVNLNRLKKDEQEMLIAAVDLGVLSTNRASGSFMGAAAIRAYRLVNGDKDRAIALVRALTSDDPATVQRTIDRLAQLGASREFQLQLANAFGTGVAMERGRAAAAPEEDQQ